MIDLYKYVSFKEDHSLEYREKLLAKRQLYFNEASNFNDPLDCNISSWERAKGALKPARFFCLSKSERDDNLMFAHYGDEHRGIRLKFVVNEECGISDCSVLAMGRDVVYSQETPCFSRSRAHELYYLKSNSWEYEKEYRIVAVKSSVLVYEETELKEVALGARFDMSLLSKLKKYLEVGAHKNVSIVHARQSESLLNFQYVPINA